MDHGYHRSTMWNDRIMEVLEGPCVLRVKHITGNDRHIYIERHEGEELFNMFMVKWRKELSHEPDKYWFHMEHGDVFNGPVFHTWDVDVVQREMFESELFVLE